MEILGCGAGRERETAPGAAACGLVSLTSALVERCPQDVPRPPPQPPAALLPPRNTPQPPPNASKSEDVFTLGHSLGAYGDIG